MSLAFKIGNVVGYQLVWLASVYGAAHGMPWLGAVVVALFAAVHLSLSPSRQADLRLIAIAIVLGFVLDSLFAASGLLKYASPWPSEFLAPVWILSMWVGFALTLHHSMGFLRLKWMAASAFGLIGGPLAYWAAERVFGAVSYGASHLVVGAALGLAWAIALPLLYRIDAQLALSRAQAVVRVTP